MIDAADIEIFKGDSEREAARFRSFLETHGEKRLELNGKEIPYMACGEGKRTMLTFAGGWGGVELAYDFILCFKERNRVIVVDISAFDDPQEMGRGVNLILDRERVGRTIVFGQSFSGIIGQSYFRRHFGRVSGLVLTNTPAPRPERSKKWALLLLKCFPLGLIKPLVRKKMTRLSEFTQEIPAEVRERRRFAMDLLGRMVTVYWNKKKFLNVLKLVFAFNEKDAYARDSFAGWPGKVLLVTSEDDHYYADVEFLMKNLPQPEIFKFPIGFGHMAPQVHRDEFYRMIQEFVDRLDDRSD
jgi:pimeloyl-ACP methyl ester carboxylesterase